jgi:hypothetical protein
MNPAKRLYRFALVVALTPAIVAAASSCRPPFSAPPEIPASYYQCQSVDPVALASSYYSRYMDKAVAKASFDNHILIIKGIELSDYQVTCLRNHNYIWVDLIKCMVGNKEYSSRFKVGDMIDVVGVNKGDTMDFMGLLFTDCYLIPSGSLQLPSDESGELVIIGY